MLPEHSAPCLFGRLDLRAEAAEFIPAFIMNEEGAERSREARRIARFFREEIARIVGVETATGPAIPVIVQPIGRIQPARRRLPKCLEQSPLGAHAGPEASRAAQSDR